MKAGGERIPRAPQAVATKHIIRIGAATGRSLRDPFATYLWRIQVGHRERYRPRAKYGETSTDIQSQLKVIVQVTYSIAPSVKAGTGT